MSKYEIMLILDPSSNIQVAQEICDTTFKSKDIKVTKLGNTELAYKINKSKNAIYILINVLASGEEVIEFSRKSNITKVIWRHIIINLDSEKGLNRKANPKKIKKPFVKKPFVRRNEDGTSTNDSTDELVKKPFVKKPRNNFSEEF
ncbi:MAG: 30S ribosomal protein S6 [Mycoplasmataceae bacterium]|nr:30S ribosomal protein S6 [Mycoplasmataceae bacterium]